MGINLLIIAILLSLGLGFVAGRMLRPKPKQIEFHTLVKELEDKRLTTMLGLSELGYYLSRKEIANCLMDEYLIIKKSTQYGNTRNNQEESKEEIS